MTPQERLKIWRQEQQKGKTAEDRRRIWAEERQPAPQPQQEPEGIGGSLQSGLASKLLSNVIETGADFYNAPGETLERVGRAGLEFASAFDPAGNAYEATVKSQAPRVAELNRLADERLPEPVQSMKRGMALETARPRTTGGNIAYGAGSILGDIAFPTNPESAVANLITIPFGGAAAKTVSKAIAPILKRIKARGVPAAAAEAVSAPTGPILRTGAVAEQGGIRGRGGVAALEAPPPSRARLVGDEGPPRLEVAEESPFEVSLGKERTPAPGKVGPKYNEAVELEMRKQLDNPALTKAAERSPWQDTTLAYFRANLLTNPGGRATDLGSTLVNQFADAAARPVAAAVDVVVSKLTGQRAITGLSARGTGRALGSIRQGLRDAGQVLKTGKQAIESGADDAVYSGEIRSGLGKGVDLPINGVFRVLGALDAPFRRFGFARNLFDRAKVAALNEARRGQIPRDQVTARIRELLDDEGIIRAAVRDGEAAVLSEPNKLSSGLAKLTANSPNARLALGVIQPFMRIPLNAVLKAADFSGVGGVKALYKVARGLGRKYKGKSFFKDLEDQRVFSQNVASGSFGPAAFILGMELEDQGKLEGYYYTSKRDYPNGKTPTSINIGGQNYDINRLGGFIAAPLFIGATYNRLRKQGSDKTDAFLRSFSALIQTAPALGYYGVPAKVGRFFTSEEPGGELAKEAGGIAAGFIPASGGLGAAAKALDPEQKREAEGFTGPIMNRIPVLRERLPVKKPKRKR